MNTEDTHLLWHYTSANGLLGILESGAIWASDLRFLNDSSENRRMKELLMQHLETRGEGEYDAFNMWLEALAAGGQPESHVYKRVSRHEYEDRLTEIKEALREYKQSEIFVACFSAESDSLGQWRAYGKNPSYAIGFDAEKLRNIGIERQLDMHAGAPSALPIFDRCHIRGRREEFNVERDNRCGVVELYGSRPYSDVCGIRQNFTFHQRFLFRRGKGMATMLQVPGV